MTTRAENHLAKQLTEFGLTDKEAKIYLALLELEAATVFETAKHSGINRSSAYVVLESLKKKGLVGISDDKKVRRYVAASPEIILQEAKASARQRENVKSNIEAIIPELKALHKGASRRPKIKVFEGENGAKEVYWSMLETEANTLRTIANPYLIFKRIPDFSQAFDKERGIKKVKMLAINPATPEVLQVYKEHAPAFPSKSLLIPKEKFNFSTDMGIFGDKVVFVSSKENFGVTIESQELANMMIMAFDLAWEQSKKLDKKIRKKLGRKIPDNL